MRFVRLIIVGVLLQSALLAAFILAARVDPSGPTKSGVIVLSMLSMATVLANASRGVAWQALLWICLLLAMEYSLAFHALGVLFFPGLLKDVDGWSIAYLLVVLRVTMVLFLAYALLALALRSDRMMKVAKLLPWMVLVTLVILVGLFTAGWAGWLDKPPHWS